MKDNITSEYIYSCGCTSFWNKQSCPLHDAPCIIESAGTAIKNKTRKCTNDFTIYNSHVYTYLESRVTKKIKNLLIERPSIFILNWLNTEILSGKIQKLVILDTKDRNLQDIPYDKCIDLGSIFVYTYNVDEVFTDLEGVLSWRYSSYLNCTIGQAFDSAHGIIHTQSPNTFKYFTQLSFRNIVQGTEGNI